MITVGYGVAFEERVSTANRTQRPRSVSLFKDKQRVSDVRW